MRERSDDCHHLQYEYFQPAAALEVWMRLPLMNELMSQISDSTEKTPLNTWIKKKTLFCLRDLNAARLLERRVLFASERRAAFQTTFTQTLRLAGLRCHRNYSFRMIPIIVLSLKDHSDIQHTRRASKAHSRPAVVTSTNLFISITQFPRPNHK